MAGTTFPGGIRVWRTPLISASSQLIKNMMEKFEILFFHLLVHTTKKDIISNLPQSQTGNLSQGRRKQEELAKQHAAAKNVI